MPLDKTKLESDFNVLKKITDNLNAIVRTMNLRDQVKANKTNLSELIFQVFSMIKKDKKGDLDNQNSSDDSPFLPSMFDSSDAKTSELIVPDTKPQKETDKNNKDEQQTIKTIENSLDSQQQWLNSNLKKLWIKVSAEVSELCDFYGYIKRANDDSNKEDKDPTKWDWFYLSFLKKPLTDENISFDIKNNDEITELKCFFGELRDLANKVKENFSTMEEYATMISEIDKMQELQSPNEIQTHLTTKNGSKSENNESKSEKSLNLMEKFRRFWQQKEPQQNSSYDILSDNLEKMKNNLNRIKDLYDSEKKKLSSAFKLRLDDKVSRPVLTTIKNFVSEHYKKLALTEIIRILEDEPANQIEEKKLQRQCKLDKIAEIGELAKHLNEDLQKRYLLQNFVKCRSSIYDKCEDYSKNLIYDNLCDSDNEGKLIDEIYKFMQKDLKDYLKKQQEDVAFTNNQEPKDFSENFSKLVRLLKGNGLVFSERICQLVIELTKFINFLSANKNTKDLFHTDEFLIESKLFIKSFGQGIRYLMECKDYSKWEEENKNSTGDFINKLILFRETRVKLCHDTYELDKKDKEKEIKNCILMKTGQANNVVENIEDVITNLSNLKESLKGMLASANKDNEKKTNHQMEMTSSPM
jgi:hypothetical protein